MRILFVSNLYPPNVVGGYEQLCFNVASALAARGHDVWVLTSDHGGKTAEYPAQTIRRRLQLLAGKEIYAPFPGDAAERDAVNRSNLKALSDVVAETRPDLIFAWNLFFLDQSFLAALGMCSSPVVVMLTDNWLLAMERPVYLAKFFQDHVFGDAPFLPASVATSSNVATSVPPSSSNAWNRVRTLLRPKAGSPILDPAPPGPPALSLPFAAVFGARFVRDLYMSAGIEFANSCVVHNGVRQEPPHAGFRDRSRLVAGGELRLLFAGRMVDLKGPHDAVAAMPLISASDLVEDSVRLTIVGDSRDSAYVGRLRREITASGFSEQIEVRPPVPESSLFDLFQSHDIYLFPSLYEPFSLTLIHALACGIPTVASAAGGNPEIVQDRMSGMLFKKGSPADLARAVLTLAHDPALRVAVSEGGRAASARFTFEAMVDGMEAFLADQLKAR